MTMGLVEIYERRMVLDDDDDVLDAVERRMQYLLFVTLAATRRAEASRRDVEGRLWRGSSYIVCLLWFYPACLIPALVCVALEVMARE